MKNKAWLKLTTLLLITGIVLGVVFFIKSVRSDYDYRFPEDMNHLDLNTSKGNPYINSIADNRYENGHKLGIYMCPQELEEAWNKKSKIKYNQNDATGQEVKYTLVRFLTSKGYRKDADGVNKLTNEEISAIERGVANYKYMDQFTIRNRIYQTFWEYDDYMDSRNPNNHSLMQRLEFWKASVGIIKNNWLIGVGTGDLPNAFKNEYIKMKSSLEEKQRWRSHNQYLSITVAFGVFGFLLFLVFLFYPAIKTKKIKNYFFLTFLIITMLSMIAEDTIESQPGASFVAFFYCLFIFAQGTEFPTTFEKEKVY